MQISNFLGALMSPTEGHYWQSLSGAA